MFSARPTREPVLTTWTTAAAIQISRSPLAFRCASQPTEPSGSVAAIASKAAGVAAMLIIGVEKPRGPLPGQAAGL